MTPVDTGFERFFDKLNVTAVRVVGAVAASLFTVVVVVTATALRPDFDPGRLSSVYFFLAAWLGVEGAYVIGKRVTYMKDLPSRQNQEREQP